MLSADVHLAGGRASGAGDGLLYDLRRGLGGSAVIVVLLEHLVAGARIDRDRNRRGRLQFLELGDRR